MAGSCSSNPDAQTTGARAVSQFDGSCLARVPGIAGPPRDAGLVAVTWEKLAHVEEGLHRGYYAGIIFHGSEFVPGVTWTTRRCGIEGEREQGPPQPWMLPKY